MTSKKTLNGFFLLNGMLRLAFFSWLALGIPSGWAQVLLPPDYAPRCHITHQEAVIVFHDGKECLTLEARYEMVPPAPVRMPVQRMGRMPSQPARPAPLEPPSQMAWVVPVGPGAAVLSSPADTLLEDLFDWLHPSTKALYGLRTGRPKGFNRFRESIFSQGGVAGHPGQLAWTVVPATGEVALVSLIDWVKKEGLAGLDENAARDYASRGWTFAIGVMKNPLLSGSFGPAQIAFPTKDVKFPLKFQSATGTFDLNLYLFTNMDAYTRNLSNFRLGNTRGLSTISREAASRGYATLGSLELPQSLVNHLGTVRSSAMPTLAWESLRFYAWEAKGINGYAQNVSRLQQDLSIAEKPPAPVRKAPAMRRMAPGPQRQAYPQRRGYY